MEGYSRIIIVIFLYHYYIIIGYFDPGQEENFCKYNDDERPSIRTIRLSKKNEVGIVSALD